jgi:hypothetical protein
VARQLLQSCLVLLLFCSCVVSPSPFSEARCACAHVRSLESPVWITYNKEIHTHGATVRARVSIAPPPFQFGLHFAFLKYPIVLSRSLLPFRTTYRPSVSCRSSINSSLSLLPPYSTVYMNHDRTSTELFPFRFPPPTFSLDPRIRSIYRSQ